MSRHSILRVVAKFMIPFIILFGLYVQFHGDFGPGGGGFQAGVIIAAGFVLYGLIFGIENARKVVPGLGNPRATGLWRAAVWRNRRCKLFSGGNFDYNVLANDPVAGQHLGILLVEAGVGTTVAATMMTLFFVFAGQDHE